MKVVKEGKGTGKEIIKGAEERNKMYNNNKLEKLKQKEHFQTRHVPQKPAEEATIFILFAS